LTAEMYALVVHLLKLKIEDGSSVATSGSMVKDLSSLMSKLGPESYTSVGEKLHSFFKLGQSLGKEELTINWPISEAPAVVISAANVYVFSKACSQALHCLLATHRVNSVLKNALDCTETQSTFIKKLPLTLSHSIGSAPDFHASRLTRISGANVIITEEPGEDRLVLTAEGSRASIADLRIELSDLAMTKRALVIGVPAKQASRYFLAGSTLMLMKNCEKTNCRVGFADSAGTYQLIHKTQQRSSPVLKYEELVETETWLTKRAIPSLTDTMQKQLTSFQLEKKSHVDTVELTTRFGTFYTVDIDSSLPKTQKTLSLEEFQETCEKGRSMRKTLERGEFTRIRKRKPKFQMVELRQGKSQVDIADNKKSKLVRNKRQKSGISMSYNTGIANPDIEKTHGQEQINASEKIYEKVLANLGYTSGCGHSNPTNRHKNKNHRIYEQEHWKVVVNASTGYEITLNLDKNMEFVSMTERHLSWVHATIFHGKEMTPSKNILIPENDIRFHVQTAEPIATNSNLFKFVFPSGSTDACPLQLEGVKKVPTFRPHVDQELKMAIPLAKHASTVKLFHKDGVNASIMTGYSYMGENLSQSRQYSDLSIYFHNEDLVEALENPGQMEYLVEKILRMSMEMSEELTRVVTEHIDSRG